MNKKWRYQGKQQIYLEHLLNSKMVILWQLMTSCMRWCYQVAMMQLMLSLNIFISLFTKCLLLKKQSNLFLRINESAFNLVSLDTWTSSKKWIAVLSTWKWINRNSTILMAYLIKTMFPHPMIWLSYVTMRWKTNSSGQLSALKSIKRKFTIPIRKCLELHNGTTLINYWIYKTA